MEDLVTVKATDLTKLFAEITQLRSEMKELREKEESLKAYSIQQTADLLSLHYNSVRKLIIKGKLFAKYLHDDFGKCIVPFWAIKSYLQSVLIPVGCKKNSSEVGLGIILISEEDDLILETPEEPGKLTIITESGQQEPPEPRF